ncbi:MAG TPA: hypothetical protein VK166_15630 [Chitinophagaceae bacterium]|nr:hypothetical protein [Chitinophagaceae bacterium]
MDNKIKSLRSFGLLILSGSLFLFQACGPAHSENTVDAKALVPVDTVKKEAAVPEPSKAVLFDTNKYKEKIAYMLNGDSSGKWPADQVVPREGAILPFKRVIAYYGNLYSTRMGILGELPKPQMFAKLKQEVAKWEAADPNTPVQPALHYIAVTAQGSPGAGGTYRLRMPFKQIDTVLKWASEINAIVFLDIQVGLSTIQKELPEFEKYIKMPNVHIGMDPEFSMKGGQAPGKAIGSYDAADINYVIDYMARIVKENNLPPKILVVHRFTGPMVTNYKEIRKTPEVQVVMHMDGWGEPAKKINTYKSFIYSQPVQFTGFKLFYKNDLKRPPNVMMTPEQLMKLKPMPVYIQYQ